MAFLPTPNCQALAEDCTLVTHNTREFMRVSGLRLENWAP